MRFQFDQGVLVAKLIFISSLIIGCGGGTSGTGLTSYEGQIRKLNGAAVAGATVTIVENNDSAITDSTGNFLIETAPLSEPGNLKIETSTVTSTVQLKSNPRENEKIHLNIQLDEEHAQAAITEVKELAFSAEIVGACDRFFENREVIRQGSRVPSGLLCTLRAKVSGDGRPLSNIGVAIQTRACKPGAIWITEESGLTESGAHAGVIKIQFHFYSGPSRCQYRVVAPYQSTEHDEVVIPFQTFAEQDYDGPIG